MRGTTGGDKYRSGQISSPVSASNMLQPEMPEAMQERAHRGVQFHEA